MCGQFSWSILLWSMMNSASYVGYVVVTRLDVEEF